MTRLRPIFPRSLRLSTVRALASVLLCLLTPLALVATPVHAQPTGPGDETGEGGASFEILGPLEDGRVVYQRLARPGVDEVEQARISILLRVTNDSESEIAVEKIQILGTVVTLFDEPKPVAAGGTRLFQNAHNCSDEPHCRKTKPLVRDAPVPSTGTVEVFLEGFDAPLTREISLAAHLNEEGPLTWPGKVSDLRPDETWDGPSQHASGHQVFALDVGVQAWDGTIWHGKWPGADGTLAEHYRAYGMPVYALADGVVCSARNDVEERWLLADKNPANSPGGNHIYVRTGDEIYLIAHLQRGSIPPELTVPGAMVTRGQYVGKVGLSGDSSKPHTHLHVKSEPGLGDPTPSNKCGAGEFRPMTFQGMQSIKRSDAEMLAQQSLLDPSHWMEHTNHSAPHPHGLLFPTTDDFQLCDGCTDDRQYVGVWREASHIELRVKLAGWEAFEETWQDLSNDRFRLVEIDTFVENGQRQFLGLFERGDGAYALWNAPTWIEFVSTAGIQAQQGLELVDFATFEDGGQRRFLGAWRQGAGKQFLWSITGWSAFTQKWAELLQEGMQLVDLETFDIGHGLRQYVGVWRGGDQDQALWSMTGWDAFTDKWTELAQEGMRLIDVETFPVNGDRQFLGVWQEGTGAYALESHTGYDKFWRASERLRFEGLRLVDIHVEP